jgi:hypothetical protein
MVYASFVIEHECEMRMQALRREAEHHRLLRDAGLYRRGWWSRGVCSLLRRLGRLLETLGQQLQQVGQPSTMVLKVRTNGGCFRGMGSENPPV